MTGAAGSSESGGERGPGRIGRRQVYDGRIVRLSVDTVRFPDGSTGQLEHIRHPGAAAVVGFVDSPDTADPGIVLIHQYRYSAGGYLYEIPAGLPEGPGESWDECAHRELGEETGFEAEVVHYLGRIYTTPGFTDELIHLFAATGLRPGPSRRDEDEYLEVVEMPFSEALDRIRTGEIVDGKSVAALLFAHSFLDSGWDSNPTPAPPRG